MLKSYFESSLIDHHISTYNNFILHGIQDIVDKEPRVTITTLNGKKTYLFSNANIELPEMTIDKSIKNDFTYRTKVYVEKKDIDESEENERVCICEIPVMINSVLCTGEKYNKDPLYNGKCIKKKDPGGYFIINGVERVLVTQARMAYNVPIVVSCRSKKYKYVCKVRSMSENTGHSSLFTINIDNCGKTTISGKSVKDYIEAEKQKEKKDRFKNLFPHMGVDPEDESVISYIEYMEKILIKVFKGEREIDEIDNIRNKRFESSGILLYDLFQKLYKRYLLSFSKKGSYISDIITNGINKCFLSQRWAAAKTLYYRSGVSQVLSRHNYHDTVSHLRRLMVPIHTGNKKTDIHYISTSQFMFICPSETPEGQNIGTVTNLALSTKISQRRPGASIIIRDIVSDIVQEYIGGDTLVMVNGYPIKKIKNPERVRENILIRKKNNEISYDVSISYDTNGDVIHVLSDEGRLIRPLFVGEYDENKDWITNFKEGKIRYLDAEEISCALKISFNCDCKKLKYEKNEYKEISFAFMLGVMASTIPYISHSQSPRNCYQSSMGKQAIGVPMFDFADKNYTSLNVQMYSQKPLVYSEIIDHTGFSERFPGLNCIVAVACYGGFNQEDSIILNKGSIDRGLFISHFYKTYTVEEIKNEIKICDKTKRKDLDYSFLDKEGIIKKGSRVLVDEKTVLVSIVGENGKDSSVVTSYDGQVISVFTTLVSGKKVVKVTVRTESIPEPGDKFTSLAAQKGTCGIVISQEDMPFTSDGTTPDLIINPHAIPSRMTVNYLLEMATGKKFLSDQTKYVNPFDPIDDEIFKYGEKNVLYNGLTGRKFFCRIFTGPLFYQKLKHLVSQKIYSRTIGDCTILTRQPVEGRARGGGLKFGEMEKDCLAAHGASYMLHERLYKNSDEFFVAVCDKCKYITGKADFCEYCSERNFSEEYECEGKNTITTSNINIPYSTKLLFQLLQGAGIGTKITKLEEG